MDDDITDNVYDGYSEDYNSDIYESVNDNDVYDDEKYDDTKYNDMNDDNFISEKNKNTALITALTFQKMKIMEMTFIMNMIMIYQKMD